jgi:hypothetical protein
MRTGTQHVHFADEWPLPRPFVRIHRDEAESVHKGSAFPGAADNKLLAHLPPEVLGRLAPYLQPVRLARQEALFRAQEPLTVVYFPDTAVVSLVSQLESGQALEVGLTGHAGDRSRWCRWYRALSRDYDDDVRRNRAHPRRCSANQRRRSET